MFRRQKKEEAAVVPLEDACATRVGATRIADLAPRRRVEVVGEVTHVCTVDIDGVPGFEIELHDGTATMVARWTGRPSIRCIEPGRRLALFGRAAPMRRDDTLLVHNPRYELLP
jgi:hypothetical protein